MPFGILGSIALSLWLLVGIAQAGESGGDAGATPYMKLETFTVNLKDVSHFLQIDIALKFSDPATAERIKAFNPLLRNNLIYILSNRSVDEINTLAGKLKLMEDIKVSLNKELKLDPKHSILSVLFESFVIQ
ncbi:MAG: flagellar basal body-associated FliL family protein [Burkholderiales bacterium]